MTLSKTLRRMYDQRLTAACRPIWSPGLIELNLKGQQPPALETAVTRTNLAHVSLIFHNVRPSLCLYPPAKLKRKNHNLFSHWCYYLNTPRESVSPVCRIFTESASRGQFSHKVAMSGCLFAYAIMCTPVWDKYQIVGRTNIRIYLLPQILDK